MGNGGERWGTVGNGGERWGRSVTLRDGYVTVLDGKVTVGNGGRRLVTVRCSSNGTVTRTEQNHSFYCTVFLSFMCRYRDRPVTVFG